MKFRELVHSQGQAGVPSNLRATTRATVERRPTAVKTRKTKEMYSVRRKKALAYIKDHEGEVLNAHAFAQLLGYARTANSSVLLQRMAQDGDLRVAGTSYRQRFYLVKARPDLPKGDDRNGPVIEHKVAPPEEAQAIPAIPAIPAAPVDSEPDETPYAPEAPTAPTASIAASNEELDRLIWRYIKDGNDSMSTVLTLITFSKWADKQ